MNIAPVSFANISFSARKNNSKNHIVPQGIDYSLIDEFKTNKFSKSELAIAAIDGKLTQEMIDEMVLNRVPKTIKHAVRFASEHPEFDKDEVSQELIALVVQIAHSYKGQCNGNFNDYAYGVEYNYLNSMLTRKTKQDDWFDYSADLRNIEDKKLNVTMRALLAEDVQSVVKRLNPVEKEVLEDRYGLGGLEPKDHDVCADKFGLPVERIKQIESAAIRHMCHPYRIYDICEDVQYLRFGDDNDKLALLLDRDKLTK